MKREEYKPGVMFRFAGFYFYIHEIINEEVLLIDKASDINFTINVRKKEKLFYPDTSDEIVIRKRNKPKRL